MVVRPWFLALLTLLALVSTANCEDLPLNRPVILNGSTAATIDDSATDAPPVSLNSTFQLGSSAEPVIPIETTTPNPVPNTTEEAEKEEPEEKTMTEQIRTYIEDSVKSVKSAISKIGKFVGKLFDESPANATVTTKKPAAAPSTPLPASPAAAASTLPPSTDAPPQ